MIRLAKCNPPTHKLIRTHEKCIKNALIENMIQVQVLLVKSMPTINYTLTAHEVSLNILDNSTKSQSNVTVCCCSWWGADIRGAEHASQIKRSYQYYTLKQHGHPETHRMSERYMTTTNKRSNPRYKITHHSNNTSVHFNTHVQYLQTKRNSLQSASVLLFN